MHKVEGKVIVRNEEECCEMNGRLNVPHSIEEGREKVGGLGSLVDGLPKDDRLDVEAKIDQALSDPIRLKIMYVLDKCNMCPCLLKGVTFLSVSSYPIISVSWSMPSS